MGRKALAEKKTPENPIAGPGQERFRRPRRRVQVRRRAGWRRTLRGMRTAGAVLAVAALAAASVWQVYAFARDGRIFRLEIAEGLQLLNAQHVSAEDVRARFAGDAGKSVFQIPLTERRSTIEEIPWVEAAAVARFLPNRLQVYVVERTPVAYVRQGSFLWLIDAGGVLLPVPEGGEYDFPVLTGIPESFSREQRAVRVKVYLDLLELMDAGEPAYSEQLSEVDVGDLDDVQVVVADPGGAVRIHFGRDRYRKKFETFLEHRSLWRKRGERVHSVDLRYRGQIVLNPGRAGAAR